MASNIREFVTRKVLWGGREQAVAEEGTSYVALGTPGTGIAGHAAPTTFDATKPILLVYNGGNYNIYPLYLRLALTAASVGNTVERFTQVIDTGNRFSSGGTALTKANTNMASSTASGATITAGAVVATAASGSARTVANQTYRTVLGVVGDVYAFNWGHEQGNDPASLITSGTAIANVVFSYAPICIGPNQSFLIHQWAAAQSAAPSFEFEFGYAER